MSASAAHNVSSRRPDAPPAASPLAVSPGVQFPPAAQPEVMRAAEKDELYAASLGDMCHDAIGSQLGHRVAGQWGGPIRVAARCLYYLVTTGAGSRTLGEEYCDIVQVRISPLTPARRLSLVLLHALLPAVAAHISTRAADPFFTSILPFPLSQVSGGYNLPPTPARRLSLVLLHCLLPAVAAHISARAAARGRALAAAEEWGEAASEGRAVEGAAREGGTRDGGAVGSGAVGRGTGGTTGGPSGREGGAIERGGVDAASVSGGRGLGWVAAVAAGRHWVGRARERVRERVREMGRRALVVWAGVAARGGDVLMLLGRAHLLLFYWHGSYLHVAKRVTGVRYIYAAQPPAYSPRFVLLAFWNRNSDEFSSSSNSTCSHATPCPSLATPCPSPATPRPSHAIPRPSYATPRPSHATPRPSHATPRPSHATPCPSHATPCPSHATPCPSLATPCPSHATPCPSHATPCPSHATSCPSHATPCPSHATPCPSLATPCPSHATPCPSHATPCPSLATPRPSHVPIRASPHPSHAIPSPPPTRQVPHARILPLHPARHPPFPPTFPPCALDTYPSPMPPHPISAPHTAAAPTAANAPPESSNGWGGEEDASQEGDEEGEAGQGPHRQLPMLHLSPARGGARRRRRLERLKRVMQRERQGVRRVVGAPCALRLAPTPPAAPAVTSSAGMPFALFLFFHLPILFSTLPSTTAPAVPAATSSAGMPVALLPTHPACCPNGHPSLLLVQRMLIIQSGATRNTSALSSTLPFLALVS
ncbi:unnamed protein product [Closterium sp. Naga37s-1]|nr:unnamed protein product [Closterium sp. Naga37s-1]